MEIKDLQEVKEWIKKGDMFLFKYLNIIEKNKKTDEQIFIEKKSSFDNKIESGIYNRNNIEAYYALLLINIELMKIINKNNPKIIHLSLLEIQGILTYFHSWFEKNQTNFINNFEKNLSILDPNCWENINNFKLINSGLDKFAHSIFLLYCPDIQKTINKINKSTEDSDKISNINTLKKLLKKSDFTNFFTLIKKYNLNLINIDSLMKGWEIIVTSFYWELSNDWRNSLEHRINTIEIESFMNLNPLVIVNLYILIRFFWLSINLKLQELDCSII